MTVLSINVNKIALIRNSRGEDRPNLLNFSKKCLDAGAGGITVHPRPDERHIRYDDLEPLKKLVAAYDDSEFNIEGYPSEHFLKLVCAIKPDQVTLVPDPPEALTSSFGWDTKANYDALSQVLKQLKAAGIRSSLFVDETVDDESLKALNPDRVELYTYNYAHNYEKDKQSAIKPFKDLAKRMRTCGLDLNAGHDLNQYNVEYFLSEIPEIEEVSIGHAFICDCIENGFDRTIDTYLRAVT